MLVLLAISMLAAALVPPPDPATETSTPTSTTTDRESATGNRPAGSKLVRSEIAVPGGAEARPREIEVDPGDQLSLVVTSGEPGEVRVPDFGLIEFAGPGNTASFDILVEERGRYPVQFRGAGTIAEIVAQPADKRRGQP
jgi:hypothetical protein